MNKKIKILLVIFLNILAITTLSSCRDLFKDKNKITVTDMVGTEVTVKKNPSKVACISRTTYDLLVAYGLGDKIDGAYSGTLKNKWLKTVYPKSKNHYVYGYKNSYELFLTRGVDLVFAPEKHIADELNKRGITALCVSLYAKPDFSKYVNFFSKLITQIWDSSEVKTRASAWEGKVNQIITQIKTTLAKNNVTRQKLYYIRGDKPNGVGYTDNKGSFTEYAYSVLGFDFLGSTITTNRPSNEEILKYNPDVIVAGGIYQTANLLKLMESPFDNLKAVENRRFYNIPIGVTAFEQLSAMTPLFFAHQAQVLHPNLFNFDVTKMIKETMANFFNYQISDKNVLAMLAGTGPDFEPLV